MECSAVGPMGCGSNGCGSKGLWVQWDLGPMGCGSNGLWVQLAVRPMGFGSSGLLDQWAVGLTGISILDTVKYKTFQITPALACTDFTTPQAILKLVKTGDTVSM